MTYSDDDFKSLISILGRRPKGLNRVIRYNIENQPAIIEVQPWVENRPSPTLYWLTCPLLKKEISKIEAQGLIKEMTDQADENFWLTLEKNHLDYRKSRQKLLNQIHPQWKEEAEERLQILTETGIGGIRELRSIKCFHLHYAHYGATEENIIGEILEKDFRLSRFLRPLNQ